MSILKFVLLCCIEIALYYLITLRILKRATGVLTFTCFFRKKTVFLKKQVRLSLFEVNLFLAPIFYTWTLLSYGMLPALVYIATVTAVAVLLSFIPLLENKLTSGHIDERQDDYHVLSFFVLEAIVYYVSSTMIMLFSKNIEYYLGMRII